VHVVEHYDIIRGRGMKCSWRFVCWIGFVMAMAGCRDVTNGGRQISRAAPVYSDYNPPPSRVPVKHVGSARQIVITNAFVVNTNYLRPEPDRSLPPIETNEMSGFVILRGTYHTATNLAKQIARADRIIAENVPILHDPSPVTFLLSGNAAKQVAQAVSSSGRYSAESHAGWFIPDWELQFYKGGKHLASVPFMGSAFTQNDNTTDYTDYSGVLGTLYDTVTAAAEQ